MFRRYWHRFAALAGAATLMAAGVHPAAAASLCPTGRVPAFEAPNVTLTPITGYLQEWGSDVPIVAFCQDPMNDDDTSMRLANIAVTGVSLISTGSVPDLQISISADGTGPYVGNLPVTFPGQFFTTPGVATDSTGTAHLYMKAKSASTPNIGGPDGTAQLIGLHLDYSFGPVGGPIQYVAPDEGQVFAQTPELDSLILFGSGAAGIASYGLMRMRARKRD